MWLNKLTSYNKIKSTNNNFKDNKVTYKNLYINRLELNKIRKKIIQEIIYQVKLAAIIY